MAHLGGQRPFRGLATGKVGSANGHPVFEGPMKFSVIDF